MTPEIEQALRTAATEARIVDPDLVTLPVFEEIVGRMASDSDAVRAVAEMAAAAPANCFCTMTTLKCRAKNSTLPRRA